MLRPKITDRYVLRMFVTSYVPLVLTFTLLFVVSDSFTRLDKFLKSGAPLHETILRYYGAKLPVIFVQFGSFITLAAGMFAMARLQRNNEILPLKGGGISVHRATVALFACAAILGGLVALDAEFLIPRLAPEIRMASRYQRLKDVNPGILRDRAGNTLFARRYRPSTRTLYWVTFRRHDREGREAIVYLAERARWVATDERSGAWLLEDGLVRDLRPGAAAGEAPRFPQRRFGSGDEGERIETSIVPIDIESLSEPVSLLSFGELRDQYRRQRFLPRLRVQLHERITGPLAHLLLLLIGLPFVLREGGGRASVFIGLLALVVICAGYFVVTFMFHALGAEGVTSPIAAAWVPVVVFSLFGVALFDRVRT